MKYWLLIISLILVAIICTTLIISCSKTIDINFAVQGKVIFKYGEKNINQEISADNFSKICNLFNGKRLYSDNPSCGFTKDVSIVINETETFCIACDSCPIIYWENKNKYFKLSTIEYEELKKILSSYGFEFPCI